MLIKKKRKQNSILWTVTTHFTLLSQLNSFEAKFLQLKLIICTFLFDAAVLSMETIVKWNQNFTSWNERGNNMTEQWISTFQLMIHFIPLIKDICYGMPQWKKVEGFLNAFISLWSYQWRLLFSFHSFSYFCFPVTLEQQKKRHETQTQG